MSTLTFLCLIFLIQLVQSDRTLFDQAYIKYVRHGKRQVIENVEYIDDKSIDDTKHLVIIKTKWMETLHPQAVRNLKNLQELFLPNCGISRIEPTAFFNLPNLTVLHLQDNQIREIKNGVFNNLPIKILALHRNSIDQIDSAAFDNMPNLFRIKLNSNRLKNWDAAWFANTPKLTELYFRRNKINYLPSNAFANIRASHLVDGQNIVDTKIFLSKNKLGQIDPVSFYGLEEISQLYLDRNRIERIPDGAFRDLKAVDVIYLARNRISEIKESAFPKVRKIGILDLSSNLLECLPYELVTVANLTNLEKNNGTCDCVKEFRAKLKEEKRKCEISYDRENCAN